MTPEQHDVIVIKSRIQRIADKGIARSLLDVADQLEYISALVGAGIDAANNAIQDGDVVAIVTDEEAHRRAQKVSLLMEELSSIHSTLAVVICAFAAARNNAMAAMKGVKTVNGACLDTGLDELLRQYPDSLSNEAARLAVRFQDTSPLAVVRRQLDQLFQDGEI